jgi:hypothetical protein
MNNIAMRQRQEYALQLLHLRNVILRETIPKRQRSRTIGQDTLTALAQVERDLSVIQWQIARAIEEAINKIASRSWGSAQANKMIVTKINDLLRNHAVGLVCPTCAAPALLFLQATGTARDSAFQFQHSLGHGRQTRHTGSQVMPVVSVIPVSSSQNKNPA